MSCKLNMQDIVELLVSNNEISNEEADQFVAEFFSLIEEGLSTDELAKIKDFGTFKLTHIQERESIDVNTREKILIPAHRRVSFVPAQVLKNLVNKPFAHFETTPLNEGTFIDGVSQDDLSDKDNEENGGYDDVDDRGDDDKTVEKEPTNKEPTNKEATDTKEPIIPIADEIESNEDFSEVELVELSEPIAIPILPTDIDKEEDEKEEEKKLSAQLISSTTLNENEIVESAPTESSIEDENKESSDVQSLIDNSNKRKSNGKPRRYIRWYVASALLLIFVVGFAFNYYFINHESFNQEVTENQTSKSSKETASALPVSDPVVVIDSLETANPSPSTPPKTVKMSPGRTLRLIALDKLGNREFWVYIYLNNKDKINNPDVIPIGIELELPNKTVFPMDANNADEVAKAKKLGDEVMKTFW